MPTFRRRLALGTAIAMLACCGMGGCGGRAERLPGGAAGSSSTSAESKSDADPAAPQTAAERREKKAREKELSDAEWKRKAEQAEADVKAAQKKLEQTTAEMEENFAKIGKELHDRRDAADAAAEKAKQEALDRFDAATQPKPETEPVPKPDQRQP